MSVDMMVVLLVKDDITDKHLHPYIESRTLRVYMYVYYGQVDKEMDFHTTKINEPFGVRSHFLKDFWEPMSVDMRVVLLVGHDKTLYIPCRVWNSWGFS